MSFDHVMEWAEGSRRMSRNAVVSTLLVGAEQEKIRDCRVVQIARHRRMQADAVERVADDDGLPDVRVEQRLHAKVISRAKQTTLRPVPHSEDEVAQQMGDAVLTPDTVGAKDQFRIRGIAGAWLLLPRSEFGDESPAAHPLARRRRSIGGRRG